MNAAKWDILAALRQQEAEARAGLGLEPLADPLERHRPFLTTVEDSRPPDAPSGRWETAMRGPRAFLAAGHGDAVDRLGWPRTSFTPSRRHGRASTFAGLLVGDCEVTEVTSTRIQIKTASGATQSFYRRPKPDFDLIYRERLRLSGLDAAEEETKLRAFEFAINACCRTTAVSKKQSGW